MNWAELVGAVAERSGARQAEVRRCLDTLSEVMLEAVGDGDRVTLKNLGSFELMRAEGRVVRSVANGRKMWVGERFRLRYRPALAARTLASEKVSEDWRSPEHQAAWRLAQTLVGDLSLYHSARTPSDLSGDDEAAVIRARCEAALGSAWRQAARLFDESVKQSVTDGCDYLAMVACKSWTERS